MRELSAESAVDALCAGEAMKAMTSIEGNAMSQIEQARSPHHIPSETVCKLMIHVSLINLSNEFTMEEHSFDSSRLHEYLRENLADFPPEEGELKVFKFR